MKKLILINIKYHIISLIVIVFCASSCKKKVEPERPEFIGTWIAVTDDFVYRINVDENSYATYKAHSLVGGGTYDYSGIARANNTVFKIGRFHSFNINVYPHKIDTTNSHIYVSYIDASSIYISKKANWEMELRQVIYHKADY